MSTPSSPPKKYWLQVALDVPLPGPFDYWHDAPVAVGVRVLVPFGRRRMIGMVVEVLSAPVYDAGKVRPVTQVLDDLPRSEERRVGNVGFVRWGSDRGGRV